MDYKGQTAIFSAIFVLVGMMLLVPTGTEKALAAIHAVATGTCGASPCQFTLMFSALDRGAWTSEPTQSGTRVTWATTGGGLGDEKGVVGYKVGAELYSVVAKLYFENPAIGSNKCNVEIIYSKSPYPPLSGSCHAGSGFNAEFTYTLRETEHAPGR
jgi:hypothetical protein